MSANRYSRVHGRVGVVMTLALAAILLSTGASNAPVLGAPAAEGTWRNLSMRAGAQPVSLDLVNQDRVALSTAGIHVQRPQVAVAVYDSIATVHVVWEQASAFAGYFDLMHRFRRFDLQSSSWIGDWSVVEPPFKVIAESASLAARGDLVYVAYEKPAAFAGSIPTIRLMRFYTDALRWSDPMTVAPPQGQDVAEEGNQPSLSIDPAHPNRLWLAWIDNRDNSRKPTAARLNLDGQVELSGPINNMEEAESPSIGADLETEGSVWATWNTHDISSGNGRVWLAEHEREDLALNWIRPEHLNTGKRGSGPRLVVSTDDVCVVWQERVGDKGKPDIFVDCLGSAKQYNFSDTTSVVSSAPAIDFGEGIGALLAWHERSPTNAIDFRTGPPPSDDTHEIEAGTVRSPHLSYDGQGAVHTVYVQGSGADAQVFYTRIDGVAPAPTATPEPTATVTPTVEPSATPSATATQAPSRTPTITPTGTRPTPSMTPTPEPTEPVTPTATPTRDEPGPIIFIPYAYNNPGRD